MTSHKAACHLLLIPLRHKTRYHSRIYFRVRLIFAIFAVQSPIRENLYTRNICHAYVLLAAVELWRCCVTSSRSAATFLTLPTRFLPISHHRNSASETRCLVGRETRYQRENAGSGIVRSTNREQRRDIFRGKCPRVCSPFTTMTA